MPRTRLPEKQYPAIGRLTVQQVLDRLGISFRQLTYIRENTVVSGLPFNSEKGQRREWPEDVVRRVEIAVALDRVLPLPNPRHSQLPALVERTVSMAEAPPERGWVLYDRDGIHYSDWDLPDLSGGGVIARIPRPWTLGGKPKPDQAERRWAVIEDLTE